jgi:hypothetical protein
VILAQEVANLLLKCLLLLGVFEVHGTPPDLRKERLSTISDGPSDFHARPSSRQFSGLLKSRP